VAQKILIAFLASLAFCCQAGEITFASAQYDVTAIAVTGAGAGFDSRSSPPSAAPVSASADSVGATDVATAGAIGGSGLLTASADVSGGSAVANAVATSHLAGSFLTSATERWLLLDFTPTTFAAGASTAATSLFVSLISGGVTLFQDVVIGPWHAVYLLTPGATNSLDLTLTSEVTAGFPAQGIGTASSFGLVTFATAVPEPETGLLLLIGLGALAAVKKKRVSKAQRTVT
jgi:hypothetical protein